jgi:uncharacterized protein (TIGR02246 family)
MPVASSLLRRAFFAAAGIIAVSGSVRAQQTDAQAAMQIEKIMDAYATALRSNDVEGLVALHAAKGVFIRDDMAAVVGRDALRAAYKQVFATLRVDLKFKIQEIESSGDMAWLRSTSAGRIKVLASGAETNNAFNQLIVFRRENDAWKIRSYLYASSQAGSETPK